MIKGAVCCLPSTGSSLLLVQVLLLVFHYQYQRASGYYHAYEQSKETNKSSAVCELLAASKSISSSEIDAFGLWKGLHQNCNLKSGDCETLFGFKKAISIVFQHQNPSDCSAAKFMITQDRPAGIGSSFSVLGDSLMAAIDSGRVLLLNTNFFDSFRSATLTDEKPFYFNNRFCLGQNKSNIDCYFLPWSNCSLADAFPLGLLNNSYPLPIVSKIVDISAFRDEKVVGFPVRTLKLLDLPNVFKAILDCSPIPANKYNHWATAVALAYFMRPNRNVYEWFEAQKSAKTLSFDPISEECVGVYVRHGDKGIEMKLVDTQEYLDHIQPMIELRRTQRQAYHLEAINSPSVIFIGSEDQAAIDSAVAFGLNKGWKVIYTNFFNRSSVADSVSASSYAEVHRLAQNESFHSELEYLNILYNVDALLKCNSWICTLGSNFCRMLDRLRATVGNKVNMHYLDLSCLQARRRSPSDSCIDSKSFSSKSY